MAEKLKLGIIGMSDGNGHPYSWSAIFNGYDMDIMKDCPFPAIPAYLAEQSFPEDSLGDYGEVTHIWTQNIVSSKHIAASTKIGVVVDKMEDIIGEVDAVLFARDDAENHYKMTLPFLKAGIPIFIDKPLALSVKEANNILINQQYENQVFSCSSIRYAEELKLTEMEVEKIGGIIHVEAAISKKWDTYSVHLIEPIVARIPHRGKLINVKSIDNEFITQCMIQWENVTAYLKVTGRVSVPIVFKFFGEHGIVRKEFSDSYSCFKKSLHKFIEVINKSDENINRLETMEIVKIIELGRK